MMNTSHDSHHGSLADWIWHVLFFDALVLFLRFGGYAIADLLFHACCLIIAGVLLWRCSSGYRLPKGIWLVFYGIAALALVQTVPVGHGLLAWLAPIKHRIFSVSSAHFPDVTVATSIAMVPPLHWLKFASLCLDMAMVAILLAAPRPQRRVFYGWFFGIGALASWLAILNYQNHIETLPFLRLYSGTHGGIVNRNHFAMLTVTLLIMTYPKILKHFAALRQPKRRQTIGLDQRATEILWGFFFLIVASVFFVAFSATWSRSGVLNFVVSHFVFLFLLVVGLVRQMNRHKYLIPAVLLAGAVLMLFLPLGRGLERFQKLGATDEGRLNRILIGMGYLAEMPVLGAGMGASEAILDPVEPRNLRETRNARQFHNEYLQVLIEMGPLGLVALLVALFFLGSELWKGLSVKEFDRRVFACAIFALFVTLLIYSLLSFPLRVPALRVFLMLLFAYGLKCVHHRDHLHRGATRKVLGGLPLLAFGTLWFAAHLPASLEKDSLPLVERSRSYGFFYRVDLFKANDRLERIFLEMPPAETVVAELPEIRAGLLRHLRLQPFSLKALNNLFIVDVLQHRFRDLSFDPDVYAGFRAQAMAISELGRDANWHSKAAQLFLYSIYEPHLPPEDLAEFERLKKDPYVIRFWILARKKLAEPKEAPESSMERESNPEGVPSTTGTENPPSSQRSSVPNESAPARVGY